MASPGPPPRAELGCLAAATTVAHGFPSFSKAVAIKVFCLLVIMTV